MILWSCIEYLRNICAMEGHGYTHDELVFVREMSESESSRVIYAHKSTRLCN